MRNKGFTLIELIVVIVILGILSAVAMPKFADFRGDAELSAVQAVAGAVSSAYTINYGNRLIDSTRGVAISGTTTATVCDPIHTQLVGGTLPSGYTMAIQSGSECQTTGSSATCIVSSSTKSAAAIALCTG